MLQQTFPDLSENEIEAIEEGAWTQSYKAGAMICRQGDPGETLFILTKGQVEISIQPDNESRVLVRRIEAPSYFGEMALLGQIYRSATVTAATDCETLKIDRESFISIVESNRVLLMALSNRISDHLYNNDQTIIAELRKKNDALQSAYDNLAEQEQLRTEFITTLSHELRTPLTSVQGFLHLINKGAAQGKSLEIVMDSVNRNVEKMVQLTNNLLVLYEMHLSEPVVTNLSVADLLIDAMQEARSMEGDYVTPIALTMFPGATRLQGE
jgi:CRP-like cAMP-binding protein